MRLLRFLVPALLLAWPAAAQVTPTSGMQRTGANVVLPDAAKNLLANSTVAIFPARAYGSCTWDATHDVGPCINSAIAAAAANGGGIVKLPLGRFGLSTTVVIGDGSASGNSTINAVVVQGTGMPLQSLGASGLGATGTALKWIGATNGTMAKIAGPSAGNAFQNVAFDAADSADTCLLITSGRNGLFPGFVCGNYLGKGLSLTTVQTGSGATTKNVFYAPLLYSTNTGSTAVDLDGWTGDGSTNGSDTTDNTFIMPKLDVPGSGSSKGFRVAFADQNFVTDLVVTVQGSNDGTSCAIDFVPKTTVQSSYIFPQTNRFGGLNSLGVAMGPCLNGSPTGTGTIGFGNTLGRLTLGDASLLPAPALAAQIEYEVADAGALGASTGASVTRAGIPSNEPSLRNGFYNFNFWRASRGTSLSSPATSTYTLDGWKWSYDTTMTFTVSQQTHTLGQTAVPFNPKYFMRWSSTSSTGGTINYVFQPIESVLRYAGRKITVSAYMQSSGCDGSQPTVTARSTQNFGTGGAPSTAVATSGAEGAITVPASWTRIVSRITVPSITGKTLGSNGNDFIAIGWTLPIAVSSSCVIDISSAQVEGGPEATAPEIRPNAADEQIAARYLVKGSAGWTGGITSATVAWLGVPLIPAMRATPTAALAVAGSAITMTTPGSGDFTTGTPATVAITNGTANGVRLAISTFSGLTALRVAIGAAAACTTTCDQILLSAEY